MRRISWALAVYLWGCAASEPSPSASVASSVASGAGGATSGAGGGPGLNVGGDGGAPACAAESLAAELQPKPIDLVMVVDTSGSMESASNAVEQNINEKLADILGQSGLDYRVIALATYGAGEALCVGPPLGGADCQNPPPKPANTSHFYHYDKGTGSGSLLAAVLAWYDAPDNSGAAPNGWSAWLRPGSQKVFLVFSDTESASNDPAAGDAFDAQLLMKDPAAFGTAADRTYVFHSIIGLAQSSPAAAPWLPTDPLVSGTCTGMGDDLGAGKSLQQVSILSGGLRFPVCEYDSFDVVFQTIADSVVEQAVIACDIPFPEPPDGETIDPSTVQVKYTPSDGGAAISMSQVSGLADCQPNAFYVEAETIHLCEQACSALQSDAKAKLDVLYGCDVGFVE
jgi:hypothetical protein